MKELTSANVDAVAKEVLNGDTNSPNFKKVPMIAHTFGFDMTKLEEHRQDVKDMLSQLPKTFFPETGGGWSFLQACVREDGVQWTDFHLKMEILFAMGVALNMVQIMIPRTMWTFFPGGVPYLLVDINGIKTDPGFSEEDEAQMVSQAASPAVYGATGVDPSKPDQEGARE